MKINVICTVCVQLLPNFPILNPTHPAVNPQIRHNPAHPGTTPHTLRQICTPSPNPEHAAKTIYTSVNPPQPAQPCTPSSNPSHHCTPNSSPVHPDPTLYTYLLSPARYGIYRNASVRLFVCHVSFTHCKLEDTLVYFL